MPVSLTKIAANVAVVTFFHGEDSVTVVYYPSRVTEKMYAELQSIGDDPARLGAFNDCLCRLIKSWDVFEDDEQTIPFPLIPDRLAELPLVFRIQVLQEIMRDIRPEAIAPQMNGSKTLNSLD
ncbi:MAG: hypothetical protein ACRDHW_00870 [Ktedonobacteraceae bacterium]